MRRSVILDVCPAQAQTEHRFSCSPYTSLIGTHLVEGPGKNPSKQTFLWYPSVIGLQSCENKRHGPLLILGYSIWRLSKGKRPVPYVRPRQYFCPTIHTPPLMPLTVYIQVVTFNQPSHHHRPLCLSARRTLCSILDAGFSYRPRPEP